MGTLHAQADSPCQGASPHCSLQYLNFSRRKPDLCESTSCQEQLKIDICSQPPCRTNGQRSCKSFLQKLHHYYTARPAAADRQLLTAELAEFSPAVICPHPSPQNHRTAGVRGTSTHQVQPPARAGSLQQVTQEGVQAILNISQEIPPPLWAACPHVLSLSQ